MSIGIYVSNKLIAARKSIGPNDQISDLKAVIGKETSENHSPTCRGKLIRVGKTNCVFEAVQSPYVKAPQAGVGVRYKVLNPFAWNAFFF
jgi:hypothetical protein